MKKITLIAAVVAAFAGCVGAGTKNEAEPIAPVAEEKVAPVEPDADDELAPVAPVAEKGLAPLRVAVYVDKGARNIGAFRWLELTARAKNVVATPIDGEAVRRGALDAADVLVMPGGSSIAESRSLGPDGREKVKAFVKNGGGYVGTCAGCCLLMESSKCHPDMLHMIPFKFGPSGGHADLSISFNRRAEELAGIRRHTVKTRYAEGPVPLPSLPVKDAEVEVVATYDSDINATGAPARPSMAGQAAAIAGTYGKGKLFVLAVHPEYDPGDHHILKGAFRFVTGRNLSWNSAKRKRGQLAVGFVCDDSFGVETAQLVQRLVTEGEFDVIPLNSEQIKSGCLRRVDAVLAPAGAGSAKPEVGLYGVNADRSKEFLARGGRIFAWGRGAEAAKERESGVTCVSDAEAALAALRAFAAEPVPAPSAIPAKVARPIRAGIFYDKNNNCISISRMLDLAPEYELKILSPEEFAKGGLDGLDLVILPGGGCRKQYKALGEKGVEALKRFVLDGGKYYGVCAGAFLALQQSREDYPRLGLVPFKGDDPNHYRGLAPIKVTLTDEGKKVFAGSAASRTVTYGGGPVAIPGEPVEDTDVKVLATYAGRIINTDQPDPIEEMAGKAAFLGGRVGKGKVFLSCPHPEMEEATFDLVRDGIKYLTGVAPSPVYRDRTHGSLVVRYRRSDKASVEFLLNTLNRDSRFYVWPQQDVAHVDAVVITDKVTKDDAQDVARYRGRGLKVVVVADTPEKRNAAKKLKGAVVVDSYDKVVDALLK